MTDVAGVRRATAEDAKAVARLLYEFQVEFDEPAPAVGVLAERYEKQLRAGEVTVLLAGAGPDGFAQLRFRPWVYSDGLHSYLEELYVVPSLRGRGLGRALLEAAMEAARSEGATQMELGTSESDVAARALYEGAGFTNREGSPDGPVMLFYERELT
ncbi:MAG TPA: GNAT family N-acetyltransferase [Solirubrobacterales bacterium]|nr:GNAT family N-acetyltransferase [Solirubrobacterales bacterium]